MENPQQPYTYADLLRDLQGLTPAQLTLHVRWIGEMGGGKITDTMVLEEDHIDPSGEGIEPVSAYKPAAGEEFDENLHMTEEEIAAEQTWPAGLVLLGVE